MASIGKLAERRTVDMRLLGEWVEPGSRCASWDVGVACCSSISFTPARFSLSVSTSMWRRSLLA
jgi:hypothetical protein